MHITPTCSLLPVPGTQVVAQRKKSPEPGWVDNAIDRGCKENSWFGKKCLKVFKVRMQQISFQNWT